MKVFDWHSRREYEILNLGYNLKWKPGVDVLGDGAKKGVSTGETVRGIGTWCRSEMSRMRKLYVQANES